MKKSDHITAPTEPWKSPQLESSNTASDTLVVSLERAQDQYDASQCNGKSIMTGVMEGFQEENDAILDNREDDNDDDDDENYMSLPASTHTLLVTETLLSVSFLFAVGIACLSLACLLLVLLNELSKGQKGNVLSIPGGVGAGVRGAQFCGIFVGVLMEEEIGQGLILLRSISRGSFHHSYPHLSYTRFVLCNILRILFGYLFLLNLFITIVQADDVITIFFDVLALEFVQKLDDVAFDVAKKDLLGKQLCDATSVDYEMMRVEAWHEIKATVKAKEDRYSIHAKSRKRGFRHLLKAVYFINLAGLLTGVIFIGEKQNRGYYRCNSVNVNFGDNVWENAVVLNGTNGSYQTTLVYSYFNGIYEVEGNHDGYPRFVERNKVDGSAFENVIGAEIKYCKKEEAWVFMHQDIGKRGDTADSDCSWLLRSPETAEYNLVDVDREDWSIWTGIIVQGNEVAITCNECEKEADCNYHGACVKGKCECYPDEQYFGQHCEFENPCEVLVDDDKEFWNISKNRYGTVLMSYLRPMYEWKVTHDILAGIINSVIADEIGGLSSPTLTSNSSNASWTNSNLNESNITDTDDNLGTIQDFVANFTSLESSKGNYATVTTLFSGSRWFSAVDFIENGTSTIHKKDYHAFWDQLFEQRTLYISDPATGATPVGVDFYEIVNDAKYDDYGPFGLLKPGANITGQGYFHCYNTDL